jgi:hypothetical protein
MTFSVCNQLRKGNLMILVIRALVKMSRNYKASQQSHQRSDGSSSTMQWRSPNPVKVLGSRPVVCAMRVRR